MMKLPIPPRKLKQGIYGPATEAIRTILKHAYNLKLFRAGTPDVRELDQLVRRHLDLYSAIAGDAPQHYELRRGDWTLARRTLDSITKAAGTDDPYVCQWLDPLGSVIQKRREQAETDPHIAPFIVPPLWLMPGHLGIVRGTLGIDDMPRLLRFVSEDREIRKTAARVASQAEGVFSNAVDWELISADSFATNPFFPIVQAIAIGAYPLGVAHRTLLFFAPTRQ